MPTSITTRPRLLFFVFLLFTQFKLSAQLSANFMADPVSGCSPVIVHFTDQSTGNPTQWRWDLGNGVTSFLQNPSTSYFNAGTYTVKLVIRNAAGADSIIKNQFITVYGSPVVNFQASDSTGCFPLRVQFTDGSSAISGMITNRAWDFGDGSTSAQANPSHIYTSAGIFTVTLRVTNSFGCIQTFSKNQYIHTSDGVKAGFTNNIPGNCAAPITINFTNTTTGPGSLLYDWDFGDGAHSTSTSPLHTYTTPGSYTVTLAAVSPQGCSDTIRKVNLISIGTILSQFNSPVSVCTGQSFTIANTTTPIPGGSSWNFGDGTISTQINPVKTYATGGTYTIKLVNNFGGCMDSVSKSIFVKIKSLATFVADDSLACKVPFLVNFTNQSAGSNTYLWNFGDGATSVTVNPAHTYTAVGSYTVTLIVTNSNGCMDTLVKTAYIKIQLPEIVINDLPQKGCTPLTINPTATVTANEIITTYLWNFGDGGTSNLVNPSHVYNTAGTYDVSLTITTGGGCSTTTVFTNAVRAGNKPHAAFTANPTDICAFRPVNFTDHSTGNVDEWFWNFGDGGTSIVQNPSYAYSDTGYFNVTLIVSSNGCADTLRINKLVHVLPPIAKFTTSNDCLDKYRRDFVDQSIGATGWQWVFGDGSSSSLQNPSHVYAIPGTYTVVLTVSNATCTHTTTQIIKVVDEIANFDTNNSTSCKGDTTVFKAININPANIANWLWDFGDGATAANPSETTHVYAVTGTFTITLTVTDILGCVSTKTRSITIYGPAAAFTSVAGACVGQSNIQFTDASTSDGVNALIKWIWNYGDGTIDSTSPPPYHHIYAGAGIYNVSLTVIDNFGCSNSLVKPGGVTIAQPVAAFSSPDTNSCTDKPIRFINASVGYDLQYSWLFGDGLNSVATDPVHTYNAIGSYTVDLLVTDRYGCKDSVNKPGYINISFPKASFTVSDSIGFCPPLLVNFTNSSLGYSSLDWDFGDGNTSTLVEPSHYYTSPGIYYAMLTVTGPGGCTDNMSKKIEVRGPRGSFVYTPLKGCDPLTVTFTATTINRISFIWDFSDGNVLPTTDSVVTHTYISPGDYIPKMIITDASGCSVPVVGLDIIKVVGITAGFTLDQSRFCDSGYVNFSNTSVSNDLINGYQWSFGDGNFSNAQQPSHHYISPGVYDIQLTVNTETGCSDTFILNDTVTVFESPVITILGDSSGCVPAQIAFSGQVDRGDVALLSWSWNFNNGQSSQLQDPPVQIFTIPAAYNIVSVATDEHGCKDSVVKVINIHPVPATDAGADALVCRDSFIQLNATGAVTYLWDASSSLSCTSCAGPLAAPADSTMYFVTGTSAFGCTARDSVIIKVRQHFILTVSPEDSICIGGFVHLSATGADQYKWSPSAGLDNAGSSTPTATPGISTLYTVIANDSDRCFADTATVFIKVNPVPSVEAGADLTIVVGSAGQLQATGSPDITGWKWTPGYNLSCVDCPDPKADPRQTTAYSIQVVNSGGCTSQDELTVFVVCNNGNLFVPNTFSPNGNGHNDRFYPRGTGVYKIRLFRVYNRWGEIVFEKTNFDANDAGAGWDGTYKGQKLSPDVYVYTMDVVCENYQLLSFKGDITLLR
jgi:gliding motility-associated-like protein